MPRSFCFGKKERLKSAQQIDLLFTAGKSHHAFPVRMAWRFFTTPGTGGLLAGVSAPKRNFKKATHRNRIKRLLREAYRLQKAGLPEQLAQRGITGHVFFLYTGRELPDFAQIMAAVQQCLKQLSRKANEHPV